MKLKFSIVLFIAVLIITPFTSADLTTSLEAYYSFDNTNISGTTVYDLHNSYDGTVVGATNNSAGLIGESYNYDGSNDRIELSSSTFSNIMGGNEATISLWVYTDNNAKNQGWLMGQDTDGDGIGLYFGSDNTARWAKMWVTGGVASDTTSLNNSEWTHYLSVANSSGMYIYENNNIIASNSNTDNFLSFTQDVALGAYYVNGVPDGSWWYDGKLDEIGIWSRALNTTEISNLYNSGSGLSYYSFSASPPTTPYASENLEQTAFIEQSTPVTINGVSYAPIYTSSVTVSDNTEAYATVTIPIVPTASNTASCRVTKDGAEFGSSLRTRSLTAGSVGNLIIVTQTENLTAGTYDFGVECLRSGGGAFDVENSSLLLHFLTGTSGDTLPHVEKNFDGLGTIFIDGLIGSVNLTTSDNYTDTGLVRNLIAEWSASPNYDFFTGTVLLSNPEEVTFTIEVGSQNCTTIKRYGTGGSGSVYGVCYFDIGNETNNTLYTANIYGTSSLNASVDDLVFHLKETISHPDNINSTSLTDAVAVSSLSETLTLNVSGHTNPNVIALASVNAYTAGTSGSSGTFYFSNTSSNSSFVVRDFDYIASVNNTGVLGLQHRFVNSPTINLIGTITGDNVIFEGGDFIAYVSDSVTDTPNEFDITLESLYDGSSFNIFSVNLSDGRSFSTTTGTISVPAVSGTLSVTVSEYNSSGVPYFSNYTLNHNVTNDLVMNVSPYTIINASFAGATVNNFTVNGESTTNGKVYLRIYNETVAVNITDAISDTGKNLSNQEANVTASDYLQNYTFVMLTANAFNFSLYDEITEALITENMTIELITGASAGTYTTTNGTLYLDLLTPSDYTIRYYSTIGANYTERDFIQTLTDRERYEIDLYGLDVDEATDLVVTIKDTGGDPVETATVKLLRYYTSCNCYNVVEMAQTSSAGEAYFIVDAYDGHYKFAVEYQGQTEFLSTSPENFIPESAGAIIERTITINLGSAYFESFRELTDIARTLVYNNATKALSFTWNDPSGIVTKGCLYASYLDGVHYTDVTPSCQEASTGSVVLSLNNSVRSYKYYAELETSTTYSDYTVFSGVIDKIASNLLNGNVGLGAFLGVGLITMFALLFSFSAIAVVIVTALGVIVMSALGLFTLATGFVTGFVVLIIGIGAYLMRS